MFLLQIRTIMVFLALLLVQCAQAPQQQVDEVKTALENARQSRADYYSAELFDSASAQATLALDETKKQNQLFQLLRNYDKSNKMLKKAKISLDIAVADAQKKMEMLRTETSELAVQNETALKEVQSLIEKARSEGKDVSSMTAALDSISQTHAQVQSALEGNDLPEVKVNAMDVRDRIEMLKTALASLKPAFAQEKKAPAKAKKK